MDFGSTLVAGLGIIFGIGAPIGLVALILWYKTRKTRMIHETAMRLAEKGQPVPPGLFLNTEAPHSDLRRGVVLIALGLGLSLFMYQMAGPWSLGLIPLFIGFGYLAVWKLESGRAKGDKPPV